MMSVSVKSKSKNGSEYCYHHGWYYLKGDCVAELLGELYSTLYPGTTMLCCCLDGLTRTILIGLWQYSDQMEKLGGYLPAQFEGRNHVLNWYL